MPETKRVSFLKSNTDGGGFQIATLRLLSEGTENGHYSLVGVN